MILRRLLLALLVIAGPCSLESAAVCDEIAERLLEIAERIPGLLEEQ